MCRKLIEEEAAKAEGGSRTEARTENGRSRIGAAEVGVLRLEDFDM